MVGSRLAETYGLGNFLSGMETRDGRAAAGRLQGLGNFLSGMETPAPGRGVRPHPAPLETSLVEWKLVQEQTETARRLEPWKLP